jgi:hypothetical protein
MIINAHSNIESSGELLAEFGLQPLSNRFLPAGSLMAAPSFPLQLRINTDTGLIHQGKPFPLEELKPRYDWLTCFEPEDHLDALARKLTKLPGVTQASVFGAYSFKDDSTLRRLERLGYAKNWRIDPEQDLGVSDPCANVETYQCALTLAKAEEIREHRGAADVLIVRHVVEHAYDLPAFIDAIRCMVSPGGYIVWELPDCERALAVGDCTTVWEEHIFYFTSFTFRQLLLESGFSIVHYESVPYPLENSLVAIVQEVPISVNPVVVDLQAVSKEIVRAQNFAKTLARRRINIRKKLETMRRERGAIAMFGAGHLSVAFISLMQVANLISCVIDDNPNKKGLQMPVGGLPIVGSEALYSGDIGVCLLGLNPQNQPKVIAKQQCFIEQGGIFASIFPGSELDLEHIQ